MHSYDFFFFFFSSRRRHTRFDCDWSSDVCSSDLPLGARIEQPGLDVGGHGGVVDEHSAIDKGVVVHAPCEVKRREKGGGGRGGSGDVGDFPVVIRAGGDQVALKEKGELCLEIVTGDEKRSERGAEFRGLEKSGQGGLQSVGGIFRKEKLPQGRQPAFFE